MDQQNPLGGGQGGVPGGFGPPSGGFGAPPPGGFGGPPPGGFGAPPPGGFGAPPSGGFGMPPGKPNAPWYATSRGKMILGGIGFVVLLGMCSAARNKGGDSKSQTADAAEKCRSGFESEKLANCMAACGGGEKWACEFAETLKKDKEAASAKEAAEQARRAEERKAREANAVKASDAPASDSDEDSDDEPSEAPSGTTASFPAIVQKFIDMNELKQEEFAKTFKGTVLSGSGKVTEVEKCGFLDDSKKWGDDCVKVILDAGVPRVALYYGPKDKSKVANYSKGDSVSFSNCVGNSIKNWGFWSTATCDMP